MTRTAKIKDEEYFIEERQDNGKTNDKHYIIGRRDGFSERMHIIVDDKTGEIRVEDNQIIDDAVAKEIITLIKLPNGKIVRNAREVVDVEPLNRNSLEYFVYLLDNAEWYKEIIDHKEIWICREDCNFKIKNKFLNDDFSEDWTKVYPDKTAKKYVIFLYINGEPIKELIFISCDGGRIFVNWPDIEYKNNKKLFYWNKNSVGFKTMKIIGEYYIYKNIEGIAKMSKIKILDKKNIK